jgi:signal transduction histidine kinase/PAS domain-containing protein/DNA-dependent RNA polymerase auxiliary subunit epsilon
MYNVLQNLIDPGETSPSQTELKYLKQLLDNIEARKNVFIIGPNGTGKTFLINKAMPMIQKELNFKCYYFDMRELILKEGGGQNVYKEILKDVINKELAIETENISNELIDLLNKHVKSPTVLFFDHFRITHQEFYNYFSETCRKINSTATEQKKSGCSHIIMVFAGSLIQRHASDLRKSPLWNITEKIFIKPHQRLEANINNYKRLESLLGQEPDDELLDTIYDLTMGHKYLSKTLIQVIHFLGLFHQSKEHILDTYIDYVLDVLRINEMYLPANVKMIRDHYYNIIEYIENNSIILRIVLDLYQGIIPSLQSPFEIDQVTISGIVDINEKGQYSFSNPIYKNIIQKMFEGFRAADYCLFHAENDALWQRAKMFYQQKHKKNERRQYTRMLTTKLQASAEIVHQIIQRLRKITSVHDFTIELIEIITIMYDISEWSIYTNTYNNTDGFDWVHDSNFLHDNQWAQSLSQENNSSKKIFLTKLIEKQIYMKDWTGSWEGFPINIGTNFQRLFVYQLPPGKYNWGKIIPLLIQDSMGVYHNLIEQDKLKQQSELLKKALLGPMQASRQYLEGEQNYWDASKKILARLGIDKFRLYEIIQEKNVRESFSEQKKLTQFSKQYKISNYPYLQKFFNIYQISPVGKIEYIKFSNNRQLIGCNMSISGNMMVIETHMSEYDFEDKKNQLLEYYKLIYIVLEQNISAYKTAIKLDSVQKTLNQSKDFIYIVSRNKDILFMNQKLSEPLGLDKNDDQKTLNQLKQSTDIYDEKLINIVFETGEDQYNESNFHLSGKTKKANTSYTPIKKGENVYAVAVIMQEITYRHELLNLHKDVLIKKTVDDIKTILRKSLKNLGFDIVLQYKKDDAQSTEYFIEAKEGRHVIKNTKYNINDEDTNKGYIVFWYRKGYPKNRIIRTWESRLKKSFFTIKEDKYWPEYVPNKKDRPNFWITMPIVCNNNVEVLYSMGWEDENEWEIERFYVGKFALLQQFARSVGIIMDNIAQEKFLKKFQAMLSHALKEPIQVARMYLEPYPHETHTIRKQMYDIVDANLEMASNGLESLLTLSREKTIEAENVNLKILLLQQTQIFKAFARKESGIQFNIELPDETIFFNTQKIMLLQVLNNLIGNSIKYLKKSKIKDKCILIKLVKEPANIVFHIADSGDGLPKDVRHYFTQSIQQSQHTMISHFGIRFSREIADMLGGKLTLMETPILGNGTSYKLIFPIEGGAYEPQKIQSPSS